jgi:Ni,Fe-hydrogenase III large subunit
MSPQATTATPAELKETVTEEVTHGHRFAGLMATGRSDGVLLSAHVARPGTIITYDALVPAGTKTYPALTPGLGAALWYEREISDQFGLTPEGHQRLEPLLRPHALPARVIAPGMFTIPHGPVRSGVMESIEYLVETPGEDIPHLSLRVYYKHRGVEERMRGRTAADGVLLTERTEGVASVGHALAFCHAVEQLAGTEVPARAELVRVLHAELERLIAHLDVTVRLADAAGLAVATARFGSAKEHLARLVGRMCGSRFGRGVVVPGGVSAMPAVSGADVLTEISRLDRMIMGDARLLMGTASFLDRLRATGPLDSALAREHGALGPIGKASGFADDARRHRPYDAYSRLDLGEGRAHHGGDALTRLTVRWDEVRQSFGLLRQAAEALDTAGEGPLLALGEPADGRAVGWAEAPQGEVIYDVAIAGGRITRCHPRSASFHNLPLFAEVFAGDILTDFPFIEASFGLSVAGVAR